jgi:hypothetical protein
MAFATSNIAGVDFSQIDAPLDNDSGYGSYVETGSGFAPGTVAYGSDGSAFIYVTFGTGGATGAGYICTINTADYTAVMLTTSNDAVGDPVGAAQAAASEDDSGWLQVYGAGLVRCEQDALANNLMAATSDAGQLDDAGAAGTLYVDGITLTTARGGTDGTAPGQFNWPTIQTKANVT